VCLRDAMVTRRIIDLRPPAAPQPVRRARRVPTPRATVPHPREIGSADIIALVQRLAPDYRLDPNLVLAVIETESNFALDAFSPKNAQGLMQLIPATADALRGRQRLGSPWTTCGGGMAYLRWLLDHFNGDVELALAGYNAGEQAVAPTWRHSPLSRDPGLCQTHPAPLGRRDRRQGGAGGPDDYSRPVEPNRIRGQDREAPSGSRPSDRRVAP
jgi:hypothetical protein